MKILFSAKGVKNYMYNPTPIKQAPKGRSKSACLKQVLA